MIKCLPQGQDLLSAHPDSSNCALITLTKVCNIVLRCRRLCRVFGMCDNSDQRMRGEGGLLLLCVQRHARKAVLPALPDIVACMSSRCDATHRNVFGHSLSADVYWMCLRQLRLRILHTVSDRPSLRVTFFKSHKADPAVLGVIVSSGNRMQLLKNYWDGRQLAVESASSDEVILVKELLIGHPSTEACQSEPMCIRCGAFNTTYRNMLHPIHLKCV